MYKLSDIFIGSYPITQFFGANPASYAKFGLKGHNGVDWGLLNGTQIVSGADGTVMETGNDTNGYGIYLKVLHAGCLTIYAHLKELKVKRGDRVVSGQLIGISDNTGNSTGPHLHFGIAPCDASGNKTEYSNGFAGYIDPLGNKVTWDIKKITQPVNPIAPPTTDRRPYWFDLINQVIWALPHEVITDDMVKKWTAEYPSQRDRSGKWDKLCAKAGLSGDTNAVTVDKLYDEIVKQNTIEQENTINRQLEEISRLKDEVIEVEIERDRKDELRAQWYQKYNDVKALYEDEKQHHINDKVSCEKRLANVKTIDKYSVKELLSELGRRLRGK